MELPKEDGVQAQPSSKRFYALEQLGDHSYTISLVAESFKVYRTQIAQLLNEQKKEAAFEIYRLLEQQRNYLVGEIRATRPYLLELEHPMADAAQNLSEQLSQISLMNTDASKLAQVLKNFAEALPTYKTTDASIIGRLMNNVRLGHYPTDLDHVGYLTEGGLKGDVASFLDHDALFLCFAGVTATAGIKEVLLSMKNIEEVVVALDMDKLMNWRVQRAMENLMDLIRDLPGLHVRLMNWNMSFKGVDDFYKARNDAMSHGVNILDMTSNFITIRLEELWKREYPGQDRGFIHTCEWEELTVPTRDLTAGKPTDMNKAQHYLKLLQEGYTGFPPLVSVNGMVIDGLHRFWAYQQMGYQTVTIYQNKPWAMPAAA